METIKYVKKSFITLCAVGLVMAGNSCTSTFDELNTNPDATVKVTPGMLATKVILSNVKSANNDYSEFCVKRMFWGEQIENISYNRFGKGSFSAIQGLTNAQKMVELASDINKDAYLGLYYYLKGWAFYHATMDMGDIPYSEALQGEKCRYPKYDTQKDVFKGVLEDLAKADECFAKTTAKIDGDPFYNGDPVKWRKASNVLRLKVLMSLQKRADDTPDLKVKETFAKIVSEGNIFKGNEDNLQVVYKNKKNQKNPWHQEMTRSINVYAGTESLINPLKELKDYRLFSYFAPMQAMTDPLYLPEGKTLLSKDDWNAYEGVDAAGTFNNEQRKVSSKLHCRPNDIYRLTYEGVPSIRLGYADMNFVLAEAAERQWISGDAQKYYEEGIRASFEFVRNIVTKQEFNQGRVITDDYIAQYLTSEKVAYAKNGTSLDRLKQIWLQSYLASYFHLAWDSYYDYRRTGYPELPINPETNMNDAKDRIPVRWLYPESESNYNKENLLEAVQRQWGGAEDVNKVMWVIK